MTCWSATPIPAVVAAVAAAGLRVEGPAGRFTVAVPAVAPDDLPDRLDGPVLVAVRAPQLAAAAAILAGRLPGDGYVICLRHGLDAGILAAAVGPERVAAAYADVDATEVAPGEVRAGVRTTLLVGAPENLHNERGQPPRLPPPARPADRKHPRLPVDRPGPGRRPGRRLAHRPAPGRDPRRPALPAAAARDRPRGAVPRPECAGAPAPPRPPAESAGGFDPADLPGSLDWLAPSQPPVAERRTPRPTWTWPCGTGRARSRPCWPGAAAS